MGIKVAKFGGSSLADAEQFTKVKKIIESDPERRFVIPSAPGKRTPDDQKITDLFYLCHARVQQGVSCNEVFQKISDRYLEIIKDLGLNLDLTPYLRRLKKRSPTALPPIMRPAGGVPERSDLGGAFKLRFRGSRRNNCFSSIRRPEFRINARTGVHSSTEAPDRRDSGFYGGASHR